MFEFSCDFQECRPERRQGRSEQFLAASYLSAWEKSVLSRYQNKVSLAFGKDIIYFLPLFNLLNSNQYFWSLRSIRVTHTYLMILLLNCVDGIQLVQYLKQGSMSTAPILGRRYTIRFLPRSSSQISRILLFRQPTTELGPLQAEF